MSNQDRDLLRAYVEHNSEEAFRSLVERHVGLLVSVARRTLGDFEHLAEDVTQSVLLDLARRGNELTQHPSLVGWLFISVQLTARSVRRSELRRKTREETATKMKHESPPENQNSIWRELRPIIDDALAELKPEDREAILLRYFEKQSLAQVGDHLGILENTARMRVERALQRLCQNLQRRGVTSSSAALATTFLTYGVEAESAGLVDKVISQIQSASIPRSPLRVSGLSVRYPAPVCFGLFLIVSLALVILTPIDSLLDSSRENSAGTNVFTVSQRIDGGQGTAGAADPLQKLPTNGAEQVSMGYGDQPKITLHVLGSGEPLTGCKVKISMRLNNQWESKEYHTDHRGQIEIPYSSQAKAVTILVSASNYAITRLEWEPEKHDLVPESYTVKLQPGVSVGGIVLDEKEDPLAGAEIIVGHSRLPALMTRPENHCFGQLTTRSDEQGRWKIEGLAELILPELTVSAYRTGFIRSWVSVPENLAIQPQLKRHDYKTTLAVGVTVRGVVLDHTSQPFPMAKVMVGSPRSSANQSGVCDSNGRFEIVGCERGEQVITVEAAGYAPTCKRVVLSNDPPQFTLHLQKGKRLEMKVVDHQANPIPGAHCWYDFFQHSNEEKPRVHFKTNANSAGVIVWENAPDAEMPFTISADGFMARRGIVVRPGEPSMVTLQKALRITGKVVDLQTRRPIPHFKFVAGSSHSADRASIEWSSLDRFTTHYANGEFNRVFDEPVRGGDAPPSLFFKIEAPGYSSFVSERVEYDQGELTFDIALTPTHTKKLKVMTPEGLPAENCAVALLAPKDKVNLIPAGILFSESDFTHRLTDADGYVDLPLGQEEGRVIAVHPAGFLETTSKILARSGQVKLQAWSHVEIRFSNGDHVSREDGFYINYTTAFSLPGVVFNHIKSFSAKPDTEGFVRFPSVAPGYQYLCRTKSKGEGWVLVSQRLIQLEAGRTNYVQDLKRGRTVIGTLDLSALPAGAKPILVTLTEGGEPLPGKRFYGQLNGNKFSAEDVDPGELRLTLRISAPPYQLHRTVHIPRPDGHDVLELGELKFAPQ